LRVVSTHTYAVLLPLQSIPPLVVEEPGLLVVEIWQKHGVMTTTWNWVMQSNQLIEHQRFREQIPPSHTLGSIPSEHGAFALGKAAQSCATHGEANRWGSRIYGDTVSTIQNPNRYRLHSLHTHRELCVCEVVNSQQGGVGVTLCLQ